MRQRLCSCLTALALVLTLLPCAAAAEEAELPPPPDLSAGPAETPSGDETGDEAEGEPIAAPEGESEDEPWAEPEAAPEADPGGTGGSPLTPGEALEATRTSPALRPEDSLSFQSTPSNQNAHKHVYCISARDSAWNDPITSYLVPIPGGGFYRVDYCEKNHALVMEEYSGEGAFLQGWNIPRELPLFGGFYAGEDGFYFVFGQNNPDEDDGAEVLRVVKYTHDLERLGAASLYGANTTKPFRAATVRMDEAAGRLYIHTGHEMYKSADGRNHQANLLLMVDTGTMKILASRHTVSNIGTGYVSHSLNQFIKVDGDTVVQLDQGDGYPRSAVMVLRSADNMGVETSKELYKFGNYNGVLENYTGAGVGGLEISRSSWLTALSSIDQTQFGGPETQNIYLLAVDKETREVRTRQISAYESRGKESSSTPQLVKFDDDLFLLLWEMRQKNGSGYYFSIPRQVKYAFFDGEGNQLGEVRTMTGDLSDCKPVILDGKATWYVTEEKKLPLFYQIDREGNMSTFRATIGVKPVRVALPEDVQAQLDGSETVLAASYDGDGRMTGLIQGVVRRGKAEFTQDVASGARLFFLEEDRGPACRPVEVP